jgi:hypothetical protein
MNRRQFIVSSGTATLAAMASIPPGAQAAESLPAREFYELRQMIVETDDQKKQVDTFLRDAAIPALNRIGIKPVGVFYPEQGISPIYVLLRHKTMESVVTFTDMLMADKEFMAKGAQFIDAPASAPAFKRMESSLMLSFKGMPRIETPVTSPGRVFQLRIYESPSAKTGLKKIEMFDDAGEIRIFREAGLNPVFFGQTIIGTRMPNLTYMLVFKSKEEQKAAWGRFVAHPDWKKISAMPEYSDKAILSGITNLSLIAADYSQV